MIYVDFQSLLIPENNEKKNPNESYTNKYHVGCNFCYELFCVYDQSRKPFKSY